MRIRDVITVLENDGWISIRNDEALRQYKRHGVRGRVTLAGRLNDELPEALVRSIAAQSRLEDRLV